MTNPELFDKSGGPGGNTALQPRIKPSWGQYPRESPNGYMNYPYQYRAVRPKFLPTPRGTVYNPSKNAGVIKAYQQEISEGGLKRHDALEYVRTIYRRGYITDQERRSLIKFALKQPAGWQNPNHSSVPSLLWASGILLTLSIFGRR